MRCQERLGGLLKHCDSRGGIGLVGSSVNAAMGFVAKRVSLQVAGLSLARGDQPQSIQEHS